MHKVVRPWPLPATLVMLFRESPHAPNTLCFFSHADVYCLNTFVCWLCVGFGRHGRNGSWGGTTVTRSTWRCTATASSRPPTYRRNCLGREQKTPTATPGWRSWYVLFRTGFFPLFATPRHQKTAAAAFKSFSAATLPQTTCTAVHSLHAPLLSVACCA